MAKTIKLTELPWTDDELFERWWFYQQDEPLELGEDHEEYARRVSKLAWLASAQYARTPIQDSHAFTKRWATV